MHKDVLQTIEKHYGFSIANVIPAPRQFVAETYILRPTDNTQYFCKVIDKPRFIPQILQSLPVVAQMHDLGLQAICYPLPTRSGNLYVMADQTLIVIFNYIDAPQSYDYSHYALGKLIATVHAMTPDIHLPIPQENFRFKYGDTFWKYFSEILKSNSKDTVTIALRDLLSFYEKEIRHDWRSFLDTSLKLRKEKTDFVITHGDAPGNTLVKTPEEIFIIDWDDILLAPPERDTWFLADKPDFMRGYRVKFPRYEVNGATRRFYIYSRYFADMVEYFDEILGEFSEEHRIKNLQKLKHDCFETWLRPIIRSFNPL